MKKIIFWDFDGVLIDSNTIRNDGFEMVLNDFPREQVSKLLTFHQNNGGLSRYVKFRYFFEEIRKENISNEQLYEWSKLFSSIMRDKLINPNLLIKETIHFVKENYKTLIMHIVSGSDENELKYICKSQNIDTYFKSIHGSPTPKNELIKDLIIRNNYNSENCVLVGDSINDYEAAIENNISFVAYNNSSLSRYSNTEFKFETIHL